MLTFWCDVGWIDAAGEWGERVGGREEGGLEGGILMFVSRFSLSSDSSSSFVSMGQERGDGGSERQSLNSIS